MRRLINLVLLTLVLSGAAAQAADKFFFHNGDDPIVFLGDSITEPDMYTAYLESYILTRFPDWKVRFRNVGWSGDTSWLRMRGDFETTLRRDVLDLKPAAVTIDFGMNDARGDYENIPLYRENLTRLVKEISASGARVAVLTSSPEERNQYLQPGGSEYNRLLEKFAATAGEVAAAQQVPFVDQFHPFVAALEAGRAAEIPGFVLVPDHVHPNWAGHLIMAQTILKSLHAPALVSSARLNGATGEVVRTDSCRISDVLRHRDRLIFTRLDDCLPMPIQPESRIIFQIPGNSFARDLNQYRLQVTDLAAGDYEIDIDGVRVGVFSAAQLDGGANLGLDTGPIGAQSLRLMDLVRAKNKLFFQRWREVQLSAPTTAQGQARRLTEMDRLDRAIANEEQAINALRTPHPHRFSVIHLDR
ncbi:MAG TPA: SGNH/GDSL hydrolase family protein [Armatimonadota bacterium]|jgi:lysophospholipase L1-like esterase